MTVSILDPSQTTPQDYRTEVSKGRDSTARVLTVSGVNPSFGIGTADLWPQGGTLQYLLTPRRIKLVSTSPLDLPASTGAHTVSISGLDVDGNEISDIITMNGTSDSAFSNNSYSVINFMLLITAGSGATNAGEISAIAETVLTVQCSMNTGRSISQHGFYRVPANRSATIDSLEFNASKLTGGTSPVVNFKIYARFTPTSPWIVIAERTLDASVQDSIVIEQPYSLVLNSGADLRFSATTDQTTTVAYTRLIGLSYEV